MNESMSQPTESQLQHATQNDSAYYISLLGFAGKQLMIPQADVISVESIYELSPDAPNSLCLGHIIFRGNRVPVYSFSSAFELMGSVPENRVQCVILQHETGEFALLCENIQNIQLVDIRFEEIPACMNHPAMPLTHLSIYQTADHSQKLGLVSNADRLAQYIEHSHERSGLNVA